MSHKILGINGSSRGLINLETSDLVCDNLKRITDIRQLIKYLNFYSNPTGEDKINKTSLGDPSLLELSSLLPKKTRYHKLLSNSEVALLASLWAACQNNIEISFSSLKDHFLSNKKTKNTAFLAQQVARADALLLSGPVYFGDRGSLVHELIQFLRKNPKLLDCKKRKLYGGITVGAKRNGGQETTLIYQILDMINLGFLAVGNDSDTTAQYGGTCHAGDLGSMVRDEYGLATSMGVGRRLATLLNILECNAEMKDRIKIVFVILQESEGIAKNNVMEIINNFSQKIEATVIDATSLKIVRCLACDVCPTKIGLDEIYRCKIGKGDDFIKIHEQLLYKDAIVPVVVSVEDHCKINSNYQIFMERTRYLRRGDYALSDYLVSPLVFQEVESREYFDIRMITSLIRHNTIISKPIIGHLFNGQIINKPQIYADFKWFIDSVSNIAAAKLNSASQGGIVTRYKPVGYVVSAQKEKEQEQLALRNKATKQRFEKLAREADKRLIQKQ